MEVFKSSESLRSTTGEMLFLRLFALDLRAIYRYGKISTRFGCRFANWQLGLWATCGGAPNVN